MLYIDQPDHVGFSYDTATNGSWDLLSGQAAFPPASPPTGQPAYTFLNGTFSSQKSYATPNTTEIAAHAVWHFLQSWLATFPQYNSGARSNGTVVAPTGINLFTESYGGKYGPVFAYFFESQNLLRSNGSLPSNSTLEIQLSTLGIINGLIDDLIQNYYYPFFAFNNTYGIQAITETDELNAVQYYGQECEPAIQACRTALDSSSPFDDGDDSATDQICEEAQISCLNMTVAYQTGGSSVYDIRVQDPSPFPPEAYLEYLNTASVQSAIGAKINYTEQSTVVQNAFISTGDTINGVSLNDLAYLLSLGIRVALINGDADFICNWYGGEAVSLALASLLPDYPVFNATSTSAATPTALPLFPTSGPASSSTAANPASYASAFPAAGYADIVVNSSYVGGAVRQYANLSFSRIYDAGHFVPFYQPETAFTLFTRIIQGTDISTGETISANFSSSGPQNATYTNSAPPQPSPTCWIRAIEGTCSDDEIASIQAGQGVVDAGVWYANQGQVQTPSSSVTGGVPGTLPSTPSATGGSSTSSIPATGVYTATGTPTARSTAGAMPALPTARDARALQNVGGVGAAVLFGIWLW